MGWAMNTTTPTSGGLKWKGQLLHMENVSFTENQNIGFLNFYDGLGQGLMATLINCDFENNPNHIWWQACQNVVCLNTRIVNNNVVRGYNGIIIDSLPHYLDYTGTPASTATSCANHYYSRTFVKVNITATPAGSFRLFRSYGINFAGLEISANNLNEWDSTYIEFDPSLLSGQARPIINNRGYRYNHPDTQYQYYGTPAATEFREPHVTTTPVNVAPDNDKIHSYYVELGAGSAAITIQPPVTSSQDDGKVVEFTINNQSGGNVAVTWTGNYKTLKYIDPPNGFRTTARFRYRTYDPGGGLTAEYLQVTPWTYGEVPSTVYSLTPPVGGFIFTALAAGGEFLASTIYRTQNNLSQNNWIRFVVNNNVGVANTPVLKLQYSTDNFATVTVDLCSVSLTTAGIIVSAWVAIPAGALGEVQFRLFGSATAINTICTLGVIEAQVK